MQEYIERIELEAAINMKENDNSLDELADEMEGKYFNTESCSDIPNMFSKDGRMHAMPENQRLESPTDLHPSLAGQTFSRWAPSQLAWSRPEPGLFDERPKNSTTTRNLAEELEMISFWRPNGYM